jgi:thiamine pyrophosphokinase
MDSLDDPRSLEKYPDQRVFRYPADKDYTDTELALTFLWEQGCDEIWLIGGGGGRIDHLFALRSLFDRKRTPDRWFTDGADIYCLKEKSKLTIIHPPASIVSLFPVGEGPWKAGSHGLKWSLDGLNWNRGFFGVSNVALKGTFSVFSEEGRFLVILPYQEKDSPRV